jgi:hypothetical protein
MKKIYSLLLAILAISTVATSQTPVPMASQAGLSYTENFADIANWTNGFAAGIGANRFGSVAVNATGTIPDGARTTATTATFVSGTSGGVQRGTQNIVLLATGATDNTSAVAIDFLMDFSTVNAGTLSFDWASVNNSTGDRKGSLRVYYSTDGTTFTEIPAADVLNFTNNVPTSGSVVNVTLPAAFNNSATARLRFYYHNGTGGTTGSRPKISIDNLTVTATAAANSVSAVAGAAASEPATNGNFTISFTPATVAPADINYNFTGSASFGTDYTVSFSAGTPSTSTASGILQNIPAGTTAVTVTITPVDDGDVEGTETISLNLSVPPAGYSIGTAIANINLLDNDVAPVISVAAGTNAAEPATNGSFTINFTSPTVTSTTIDYSYTGTAGFGTDYTVSYSAGTPSTATSTGTLTIPAGTSAVTVTITPVDDPDVEPSETILLGLSNPTGGYTLGTASASINITSNDVTPTVSVAAGIAAAEPATNGTFNITLSTAAPAGGVTVNYSLTGTATLATDYTDPQSGSITIAQGNLSGIVNVNVTDDPDVEPGETIILTINSVTSPYAINTASATINLLDNDIAPISLTGAYNQNFNTLASTGTANVLAITGWSILESLSGARDNELYAADNGGSTTGDTYSYGTTAGERALGSLTSGSLSSSYGAYFLNNTGNTAQSVRITYTGKQWRLGTAGRTDRLSFQYSLNAVNLATGTWTDFTQLDFVTPNTVTTGTKNGNDPINQAAVAYTITGLSIPNGATFFIRWNDGDASSSDDGLSIDDFSIEINPVDLAAPVLTAVSPTNGSIDVPVYIQAGITFDEDVIKGTGNIYVKRISDNVTVQTIPVSASSVTTSGNKANFIIEGLAYSTSYYVEADAGTFTDVSTNGFAGITGSAIWSFTTVAPPPPGIVGTLYSFDNCTSGITDGFTQFSTTGSIVWACTPFGRNPHQAVPADSIYGVQMNGFANGTNVSNVDWLISPSYDLTGTTYPLLSYWTRTAFNGLPLQLKVSTDYVNGNPAAATWTDLNGKFPGLASNVWTLSTDINLSAFKQPNVHFAFIYTSTDDDGARWTVDDILVTNSATPPPPSLTVSTTDIQYTFVANGSSADKTFTFVGNDLTSDVTLNATGDFLLSKDGSTFSSSLLYTIAEANDLVKTVYVRFAPTQAGQNFTGTVTVATGTLSSVINLKGTSIDPATTLEVVNWNMEWFGSTLEGPPNENVQEQNVKTILQNINADVYALVEVVDEARLANVVSQLGGYSYVISNYGSHTNTTVNPPSAINNAQKLALVYKTSLLSNVTTTPLLSQGVNSPADISSNPAYNYWASGRFPFMVSADVTLNCVTKNIKFIIIHAKANTSPTNISYDRRKNGADSLHYALQQLFPNDNIIILGDFNDDLDQSITAGFTTTSWDSFTTDPSNFTAVTLPLSLSGKKSTVSYNDMIDHVVVSNELQPYYMPATATVLNDVTSLVTNYGSTTTDHYPVFSRYRFEQPAVPTITCPGNIAQTNDAGVCGAVVNYTVNHTVSCGEGVLQQTAGLASGAVFPVGTTTNTFVITDGAGGTATCSFDVIITDNTAPVITCPANITQPAGAGTCGAVVNYTVPFSDNCSGATIQQTTGLASGAIFPTGTTVNSFTVTDASGNTTSCSFNVTVIDNTAPVITCPANVIKPADAGTCSAVVNYTVPYSDNCGGATIQQTAGLASGAVFPAGVTVNSFTVTDASGNTASCSFTVTVADQQAPTFTRPANITIPFLTTCTYNAAPAVTGDVTNESDNCVSGLNATYTDQTTACGNDIIITRTWKLTDGANQAPQQVQTITVTDNATPYIIYAQNSALFGENNYINGAVGVKASNGIAVFKKGTILPAPDFARAKFIDVKPGATVPNRIFSAANNGPVPPFYLFSGNVSSLPNRTISSSTAIPVSANYKTLIIKKNVTVTITGTLYGTIEIEEGADVTFTPAGGVLNIETLTVEGENSNATDIRFGNCTSIRIKTKVVLDRNVQLNVGGPKVTFYLGDGNIDEEKFKVIGGKNNVTANVYLMNGKLKVSGETAMTTMKGWFIAETVETDGKNITWNRNSCTTPPPARNTNAGDYVKEAVTEAPGLLQVEVMPNPSTTDFSLRITSRDTKTPVAVRITDLSGRVMSTQQGIVAGSTYKTGNGLKAGVYFADVMQGNEHKVIKLIKF